ncbi:hypothetical protein J7L48_02795 [bacterium]|nr:hypothetical protein [bacterium]
MKKILIVLLFLLLSIDFYGNDVVLVYKFYLKNKSEYVGKLISIKPDIEIVIQTLDKNTLHFQWTDIEKFELVKNKKITLKYDYTWYYKKFKKLNFLLGYSITTRENHPVTNIFSFEVPLYKYEAGYLFIQGNFMDRDSYEAGAVSVGLKLFNAKKPYSIFFSVSLGPAYYDGYIEPYYWYYDDYDILPDDNKIIHKLYPLLDLRLGVHSTNKFYGCTQFFIGLRAITYQYYNYRWIYEGYYDNGYYEKEKQYDSFPIIIFGINFGF